MTNDERMAFLNEHPIASRLLIMPDDSELWMVYAFFATGHVAIGYGDTFLEALDDCMGEHQEKLGRHGEARAGLAERKAVTP